MVSLERTGSSHAPLRVLHVTPRYWPSLGGVERSVQAVCEALVPRCVMTVLTARLPRGVPGEEVVRGVKVVRPSTFGVAWSQPVCPGLPLAFHRLAREADVVHLHWPFPLALAAAPWRLSARLVITYHSDIVRQRAAVPVLAPFLTRVLERADAIVATSPRLADCSPVLSRFHGKCRVIPLGVDLAPYEGPSPARATTDLPVVLFVGRLVGYKGLPILLAAMREVQARLLIIGDGPLRRQLERLARVVGVEERVSFLGEKRPADLPPYYRSAAVLALPSISRNEAFGLVQVEAMASGLPVVSTNLPTGVPFVNVDGETGLVVPPGDSTALARALNQILSDARLRQRMGAAGRARARAEFDVRQTAGRMLAVYRERSGRTLFN